MSGLAGNVCNSYPGSRLRRLKRLSSWAGFNAGPDAQALDQPADAINAPSIPSRHSGKQPIMGEPGLNRNEEDARSAAPQWH